MSERRRAVMLDGADSVAAVLESVREGELRWRAGLRVRLHKTH
ncbi:hypothetical protein WMF37_21020 [Sorangium sp. So ce291]